MRTSPCLPVHAQQDCLCRDGCCCRKDRNITPSPPQHAQFEQNSAVSKANSSRALCLDIRRRRRARTPHHTTPTSRQHQTAHARARAPTTPTRARRRECYARWGRANMRTARDAAPTVLTNTLVRATNATSTSSDAVESLTRTRTRAHKTRGRPPPPPPPRHRDGPRAPTSAPTSAPSSHSAAHRSAPRRDATRRDGK